MGSKAPNIDAENYYFYYFFVSKLLLNFAKGEIIVTQDNSKDNSVNKYINKYTKETNIKKIFLLLCNIIMIVVAILSSYSYSVNTKNKSVALRLDNFCNSTDSMKQLTDSYLHAEKGYVDNWAYYISSNNMTMDEAIKFVQTINTQDNLYAHFVDMDDFSAISTIADKNGNYSVNCYKTFYDTNTNACHAMIKKMQNMFKSQSDQVYVLGKYRVVELQQTVISVGTRVYLNIGNNKTKPYLLLRLLPVDYLKNAWTFPTKYKSAEISLINSNGEYVIQSPSMKSRTFYDYIRGYNFQNDYNKVDELADKIKSSNSGLFQYKDYRNENCYWYYSSFGKDLDLYIIGYIPVKDIDSVNMNWSIVAIICGTVLFLIILDTFYILSINRSLRKAAIEAERASQAKTEFLSTISHDIRTPMNGVLGMTQIAKKHLNDPEYMSECLDKVSLAGNHLLTLINDILDISKIESGKMAISIEPFSLKDCVNEVVSILRPQAEDKDISLDVNMHDIIYETLSADPLRLNQIITNLLTNAVKYTDNGGKVLFDISQSRLPDDDEKIRLKIVVSDNGIGMTKEFQETMYNSFTRALDSRTNKIQGTGLGLAIIKQLVDLMNGSINCKSELGKGTTFTVYLDLAVLNEHKHLNTINSDSLHENNYDFSSLHVLVAEDNDLNWEIIETMLSEYKVSCDRAVNGLECVNTLTSSSKGFYDLILMDIQMPVMNGKEATRKIRKNEDAYIRNIPIVAMTADAFAEDIKACKEAGMNAHIPKPINMKQVLSVLITALKKDYK